MRYFATLSTAVDSEAARACVTTTDPFSIMEKRDESQFFENRQARYVDVDVEPYAVNRLCLSMRNVRDYDPPKDYHRVATVMLTNLVSSMLALCRGTEFRNF